MNADCTPNDLRIRGLGRRELVLAFDAGHVTSDGGAPLLAMAARRFRLFERLARCFRDRRDRRRVEHKISQLLAQRIFGLALGYEDLNDHDQLAKDPLLATLIGKVDSTGSKRSRRLGQPLASSSTLNRLELTPDGRYAKISHDPEAIESLLVELFLDSFDRPPSEITLDLDATDVPLHGGQEGRFFHGYYGHYCYLPLYIFCGDHVLAAKLRPSNIDASAGAVEETARIVAQIRRRWPKVKITVRADSGFCREPFMAWCEQNGVKYVLGIARNTRLEKRVARDFEELTKQGERKRYKELRYQTLNTWSRRRRVVAKVEILGTKRNPRYVVTNIGQRKIPARELYEDEYCARGEAENRIKEQQLYLYASRASAHTMRGNQLRLWFSTLAYQLLAWVRQLALAGTPEKRARADTIRLKFLKLGAVIRVTARRVWISASTAYPNKAQLARAWQALRPNRQRE